MNFDLIAVLGLVGLAVVFVVRKYWPSAKGRKSSCGSCDNCNSGS